MCGICGIYGINDQKLVKEMTSIIKHRGPDDFGYFFDEKIGLGHRRLSIIDLDGGKQPIYNEDKSVVIVFNGEIFNFKEIKQKLEKKGHKFCTNTDTEVIIHNYEEKGIKCLEDFNGFFAFALWDLNKKKLFIARDRAGIKPLYYAIINNTLLFSSEIKSLLINDQFNKELNLKSVDNFLTYRYVPGNETMFKNIFKLDPGHLIIGYNNSIKIQKYWDLKINEVINSKKDYSKKLFELFKDSVNKRMISDVPIGAYLSGGIDSSSIVYFMNKMSSTPIKTFSIGFENSGVDETKKAKKVAELFNTDHHEIFVEPNTSKLIPKILWHLDDPIGDTAIIANYLLAKKASQHVKVVLSGEGADELFGGYMQHRNMIIASRIQKILPKVVTSNIIPLIIEKTPINIMNKFFNYPVSMGQKGKERTIELLKNINNEGKTYSELISLFSEKNKNELYSKNQKSKILINITNQEISNSFNNINEKYNKNKNQILSKVIYYEFKNWLPNNLLFKFDKITMANSIEGRVPFLDHRIIELSGLIPNKYKINMNTEKYILRKSMNKILPPDIFKRKKHAFIMPISSWFGKEISEIGENLLNEKQINKRGFFNPNYIRKILNGYKKEFIYEKQFIALTMFEIWYKTYFDRDIQKLKKHNYRSEY